MKGREIFRCDIKNLYFNIDCEDDIVCQRLISVVQEANERMYDLNNLPKFRSIKNGKRAFQNPQEPENTQELLHSDVELIYEIPRKDVSPTSLPAVMNDDDDDEEIDNEDDNDNKDDNDNYTSIKNNDDDEAGMGG